VELKLAEHKMLSKVKIHRVSAGDTIQAGVFSVEFVNVNHSIVDTCALAIHTPCGLVFQTGDFKIDTTPINGEMIDLTVSGNWQGRDYPVAQRCLPTWSGRAIPCRKKP
jgi:ribonuclease J